MSYKCVKITVTIAVIFHSVNNVNVYNTSIIHDDGQQAAGVVERMCSLVVQQTCVRCLLNETLAIRTSYARRVSAIKRESTAVDLSLIHI